MVTLPHAAVRRLRAFVIPLLWLSAVSATPVWAQDGGPDPSAVKVGIGPLSMNPTISLTNLGVDNNVFNEPVDQNPKKDFTATITPATDLWLHAGRTWITSTLKEDIVWYQKYSTERAANNTSTVGWRVPLNRLNFSVGASRHSARERPGYEIDARSQLTDTKYNGLAEVRALSKTFFGVTADRERVDYDNAAVFLGSNLAFELNRVTTDVGLTIRHKITPLTTITLAGTRAQDRFEFSPLRDSNSTAITANVSFDPAALIKGSATLGYRNFHPLAPGLADFKGTTAAVNLSYVAFGATRFAATVSRDVQYSFDNNQPYYLQTAVNGSIAQQLFGPFDVIGRAGTASLAYQDRAGAIVQISNRVDHVRTYGAGIGYHMGKDLRLGLNVDEDRRISDVQQRQYNNLRIGTSITYGM
jgi:Putative beta-barrel porin 2